MRIFSFLDKKGRSFLLPFFIFMNFSLLGYTLCFYIDGDNSLYNESKKDVEEILSNFVPRENDVCIILWDRYNEKPLVVIKNFYTTDTSELSFSINSGDPDSYQLLGNIVKNNKKSGPLYLILWDHGSAWIKKELKGFGYDSEFDDYLDVWSGELKKAIEEFTKIAGRCDAIIFDACIMQTVEIDYEIKDYTDYIVASQDPVPVDGLPYGEWIKSAEFSNSLSALKFLVDEYIKKYEVYDVSLSIVSTYYMNYWWFYFRDKIKGYLEGSDTYISYRTPFSYNLFLTNNDNIDITKIYPIVLYSRSTVPRNGISAWYPETKDAYDDYISIYSKLRWAKNTQWDEYVGRILYKNAKFGVLPPDSIVISNDISWDRGYSIYGLKGYNVSVLKDPNFYSPEILYNAGFSQYEDMMFAKSGTLIINGEYNMVSIYGRLNLWIYSVKDNDTILIERINKSLKDTLKRMYMGRIMVVSRDECSNYVYLNILRCNGDILKQFFVSDTSFTFLSLYDTLLVIVNAEDSAGAISPSIYTFYYNENYDISIYPQPATDRVFFDIGDERSDVYVYTISGKIVKIFKNAEGKIEWDLRNNYGVRVKEGIYVVYVKNKGIKRVFVIK